MFYFRLCLDWGILEEFLEFCEKSLGNFQEEFSQFSRNFANCSDAWKLLWNCYEYFCNTFLARRCHFRDPEILWPWMTRAHCWLLAARRRFHLFTDTYVLHTHLYGSEPIYLYATHIIIYTGWAKEEEYAKMKISAGGRCWREWKWQWASSDERWAGSFIVVNGGLRVSMAMQIR